MGFRNDYHVGWLLGGGTIKLNDKHFVELYTETWSALQALLNVIEYTCFVSICRPLALIQSSMPYIFLSQHAKTQSKPGVRLTTNTRVYTQDDNNNKVCDTRSFRSIVVYPLNDRTRLAAAQNDFPALRKPLTYEKTRDETRGRCVDWLSSRRDVCHTHMSECVCLLCDARKMRGDRNCCDKKIRVKTNTICLEHDDARFWPPTEHCGRR